VGNETRLDEWLRWKKKSRKVGEGASRGLWSNKEGILGQGKEAVRVKCRTYQEIYPIAGLESSYQQAGPPGQKVIRKKCRSVHDKRLGGDSSTGGAGR